MPTSTKQLKANRHNAKLGGVKTAEGKNVARFNARKHGILAVLTTPYEEDLHKSFLDQLYGEYKPTGFVEEVLVERVAVCYLRLFRSGKAEVEFMKTRLDPDVDELSELTTFKKLGYQAVLGVQDIDNLHGIYMRYDTSIENRLYKAIHELERLQRMRAGERIPAPITVEINGESENGFVSQNI